MKQVFTLFLIFICSNVFSQDKTNYSISFSVLGYYSDLKPDGIRGFNGNFELSKHFKKNNILSFYTSFGFGITEKNNKIDNLQGYTEFDLLYSRQFKINSFLILEPQSGIGYISFGNTSDGENENEISLPIRLKLLVFTGKKFALGLSANSNFNSHKNIHSLNFLLHFKL
jgi:hypothetical protein